MVRDKTARAQQAYSFMAGSAAANREWVPVMRDLFKKLEWVCTKPSDCPDVASICRRNTDEPCMYRVRNDEVTKALNTILKGN